MFERASNNENMAYKQLICDQEFFLSHLIACLGLI